MHAASSRSSGIETSIRLWLRVAELSLAKLSRSRGKRDKGRTGNGCKHGRASCRNYQSLKSDVRARVGASLDAFRWKRRRPESYLVLKVYSRSFDSGEAGRGRERGGARDSYEKCECREQGGHLHPRYATFDGFPMMRGDRFGQIKKSGSRS